MGPLSKDAEPAQPPVAINSRKAWLGPWLIQCRACLATALITPCTGHDVLVKESLQSNGLLSKVKCLIEEKNHTTTKLTLLGGGQMLSQNSS